ncbi:MAG: hypothetical protein ACO3QC_07745, partial [Phycisphaerales bacterium]
LPYDSMWPEWSPDAVAAVTTAAQRHDVAVIHLVDPSAAEPPRAGFFRAREAETGRAFLGTPRTRFADPEATRAALLRTGADYLRLSTGEAFIPPLRHFLGSRGLLSRGRG